MPGLKLADFDISLKTGFVSENPLAKLPAYYDPWNNVALKTAELVASKKMREEVGKLPVLDISKLNGPNEVKLGHMQLSMMTSGFLFQDGLEGVPTSLPNCLAAPLFAIYEKYDIPPVMTYGDIVLNNAVIKGSPSIDTIGAVIDIPGDKAQWSNFLGVTFMVEYEFAKACPAIQTIMDGLEEGNDDKIAGALKQVTEAVGGMEKTMSMYNDKVSTAELFPKMWTFFGGYGELSLHNGLIFEGVKDQPIKMKGGNASQSPTMRVLDNLLGITHPADRAAHVEELMKYIYPSHRKFIQAVAEKNLKGRAEGSGNAGLKEAFNGFKAAVAKFRTYHVQVVTKYVFQAMEKNMAPAKQQELKPMKDTAMSFVQGMRDDCQ